MKDLIDELKSKDFIMYYSRQRNIKVNSARRQVNRVVAYLEGRAVQARSGRKSVMVIFEQYTKMLFDAHIEAGYQIASTFLKKSSALLYIADLPFMRVVPLYEPTALHPLKYIVLRPGVHY